MAALRGAPTAPRTSPPRRCRLAPPGRAAQGPPSALERTRAVTATSAANSPSRGRIIAARILLVLGVLLLVLSILSTYVKREALDSGQFRQTSQQLIADPAIQEAVAAQMTDALANVDFTSSLEAKLPTNLQPLASPIAGLAQGFVGTAAREPPRPAAHPGRVRRSCRALADSSSSRSCTATRRRWTRRTATSSSTSGRSSSSWGTGSGSSAISQTRSRRTPGRSRSSRPTIWTRPRRSPTGSSRSRTSSGSSPSPPGSPPSGWPVGAGGRRFARSASVSSSSALLVLVVRWLAGKYVVDQLVATDSMRPAVHNAWQIITQSLAAAGWVALVVGILVAIGAWLVGPGNRATACARRARPAPAAARDRVERVRRRDVAAHLAAPDPGLPHDGGARRRGCDRLRRLPAPAQGGVACSCTGGSPRTTRSATGGRAELATSSGGRAAVVAPAVEHDLVGAHAVVEAACGLARAPARALDRRTARPCRTRRRRGGGGARRRRVTARSGRSRHRARPAGRAAARRAGRARGRRWRSRPACRRRESRRRSPGPSGSTTGRRGARSRPGGRRRCGAPWPAGCRARPRSSSRRRGNGRGRASR